MKGKLAWCMVIMALLVNVHVSNAFVERKLALQEVISESTNIVYGTVTKIDEKRQRVIIDVKQDVKGKSNIEQIKINVAVGQRRGNLTSPEKFMKRVEVGSPAIIFYRHQGGALDSLGHVGETWFQTRTNTPKLSADTWWTFTHIEIRMHRTFKGTTADFQELLLRVLKPFQYAKPDDVKVLAFVKNRATNEFNALSSFHKISDRNVLYKSTQNPKLPDLDKAHILWIGYRSLSEKHTGKYVFDNEAEDRIKAFVRNGGVVILSGQDSDPKRSCDTGFLAKPIKGVEGQVGNGIQVAEDSDLFTTPERVQADQVRVDDAWAEGSPDYSVLALTKENNIALAQMDYGKGIYIVTAMQNGRPTHLKSNAALIQNLISLAVKRCKTSV